MRGTIVVDENHCKGCALCMSVCPKGIIEMADYFTPRGYRPARLVTPAAGDVRKACTGCLLCAVICPDAAITVYREAARATHAEAPKSAAGHVGPAAVTA